MIILWLQLIIMLVVILISAQLFTNALEHLGQRIGLSAGMTGSIFAAVATALPETIVPLLAIIAGGSNKLINQEISVGAILGAPLMLSTLSTVLMALSALKRRGINGRIIPEKIGFTRDLNFFLSAFLLAALAMFIPHQPAFLRASISCVLVLLYIFYVISTLRASKKLVLCGHGVTPDQPMILTKLGCKNNKTTLYIQLCLGLMLLLVGAKGFIDSVQAISIAFNISALLLSLLIIPIATELPEKVNSILWVRKNKDTLGFGNITGAMVFQGSLLPALGILLTPWEPNKNVLMGMIITLCAAAWLRLHASSRGLSIKTLLLNGVLYFIYLFLTLG